MTIKPQRLGRTIIYNDPWVSLYADKVLLPEGRIIERHHFLDFDVEAVGAIVVDSQDKILLVQAFRYVTDSIEWEIPAGGVEPGETTLEAGRREVREETGYETINHQMIYTYFPMNGMANKVFHLIRCQATTSTGNFDRNEIKSIRWFTRDQIRQMIRENVIRDGYTLSGLLLELLPTDTRRT